MVKGRLELLYQLYRGQVFYRETDKNYIKND